MATNCVVSLELLPGLTIAVPTTSTVDDWERSSEYLNPANYDGATYYFECMIQGISGLAVTLRDITNSADLASVTTDTTSQKRYRSTAFTPAAGNNLLQIRTPSNASANGFIYSARIVIVQANATKTRISVPLSLQYYGSATHLSYLDQRATNTYAQPSPLLYPIWPYTAANFSTISAASFECMLYSSTAGYTVYAALTKTDGTVAAECSTNSAAQQYLTAAATLVDGTSYEVRIKGDGTRLARLAKSALYLTLDPLTKGETYFLLGWGRQRTVDLIGGSSIVKLETGLYSSPIVYADYTAWLAATDDYAAGQLKLHTLGTNDTVTGNSAIASSAWNMNTTTAKAYYRAGPVTFTADNRAVQAVDYNAQAVNDCTVMAVVAFTGTSGTTLTAASTLTGLLSASATLGNTAPAATTMTAASTLTGLTAGAAALTHSPATPTTLTASSTLTGLTAGAAAVSWSPATPTTLTAESTLTGMVSGDATLANTPPPAVVVTGASTLTGYVSASADLANTPPAAVTMTAASTLGAVVSASADMRWAIPVYMTASSTLTGRVSGASYLMIGVSEKIRWNQPRPWPLSRRSHPAPAAPSAPGKWYRRAR